MSATVEQLASGEIRNCDQCGREFATRGTCGSRFCKPCREEMRESIESEGNWWGGKRVYY